MRFTHDAQVIPSTGKETISIGVLWVLGGGKVSLVTSA